MTCPVCLQRVAANLDGTRIKYHRDKLFKPCVASGEPIRICKGEL